MEIGVGITVSICGLGFISLGIRSLIHGIECIRRIIKIPWADDFEGYYAVVFIIMAIAFILLGIYVAGFGIQFYIVR